MVLIGYCPQEYKNYSWGKNLSWYSPIEVWLVIALMALVHSELEWSKNCSHNPSLE